MNMINLASEEQKVKMSIIISKIRIHNFRSLENVEVDLSNTNILIGANNSGKTNFLRAINIALGQIRTCSIEDIYVHKDEKLSADKKATIDMMFQPIDGNGEITSKFTVFWQEAFGTNWLQTDLQDNQYVGIRTIITYNRDEDDYKIERRPIKEWMGSSEEASIGRKQSYSDDMINHIVAFYMDAQRDIVEDLNNRKSYIGRTLTGKSLTQEQIGELESQLEMINSKIVNMLPALQQTKDKISAIATTVGTTNASLEIKALTSHLTDLRRSLDIEFQDGEAAKMSIAQHGMGTRSWISFLTLGAYVDWILLTQMNDDPECDNYVMLTMEEPEANLHPQAQKQLYHQIMSFNGQRIVSTHSPSIIAQAELSQFLYFQKKNGKTIVKKSDATKIDENEKSKIRRELLATKGELLFASAVVLCEGITEEQALPVFFEHYFGFSTFSKGINIIGVGGQNYKAFVKLFHSLGIRWYIFSDGEEQAQKSVKKAIEDIGYKQIEDCPQVVLIDNNADYERHLIGNGFTKEIITAINDVNGDKDFFEKYIRKNNHTTFNRHKTEERCSKCHQAIYKEDTRDYDGENGEQQAAYDCCTSGNGKALYAIPVAEQICKTTEADKLPTKIKSLFEVMKSDLGL